MTKDEKNSLAYQDAFDRKVASFPDDKEYMDAYRFWCGLIVDAWL